MLTRQAAAQDGAQRVSQELAAQEVLRLHTEAERSATMSKRESCLRDLEKLQKDKLEFEEQEKAAQALAKQLESQLSIKTKALASRKNELQSHLDRVNQLQSEVEGFRVTLVRIETEIQALLDHFRDKHSVDLQEFSHGLEGVTELRHDWRELVTQKKEELRLLGQINLMAIEEFAEIDERHAFLQGQILDLKKAREDLHRVTAEIRKESTQLFSAAFEQIQLNFNITFQRLFGGGRAELKLTEPETVLESGIEMLCQPPGKKLENINLLSGGEKSMTAVALLFATFMVKPSPFCILDEIDAALDEANVSRFVAMLTEFSCRSQFVVITHNKKTVTGSSTMIGVTMEQPGISKVLTVRLAPDQAAIA
jgi:chromosome segregation protein